MMFLSWSRALGVSSGRVVRGRLGSRSSFGIPFEVGYPEVVEAYLAKVEKPMDTSAVMMQLKGHLHGSPKELWRSVDLMLRNANEFNGRAVTPW
jgi:hypothetical protein